MKPLALFPSRRRRSRGVRGAGTAVWLLAVLGAVGCAAPGTPAPGTVTLNLVGQAPSGTVYRLRHAVITVTGPATRIWNTEDDPDRTSLSDQVPAGDYAASLAPGWNLERIEGMSAMPCAAGITAGGGELLVNDGCAVFGGINAYPQTASGHVAPLRTISGDRTGMQGPEQIRRVRGELYVVDRSESRVFVYRDTASGNVAPVRAIGGPNSGVLRPIGVAVH
jgi:hypothetical protein